MKKPEQQFNRVKIFIDSHGSVSDKLAVIEVSEFIESLQRRNEELEHQLTLLRTPIPSEALRIDMSINGMFVSKMATLELIENSTIDVVPYISSQMWRELKEALNRNQEPTKS